MKGIIFLTVSALIYTVSTTILFLKKDTINKLENRIFKKLLYISILSMVTELSIVATVDMGIIGTIVQKFFLVCLLMWLSVFMLYTFAITTFRDDISEEVNIKKFQFLYYIFIATNIVLYALVFILPMDFISLSDSVKYTTGPAVNVVFITLGIYTTLMSVMVLRNINNLHKKGYIPIISLIICLIAEGIIQKSHPELLLANFVFGFIIYIMYHTIENPDMKLLEEVHKSKEISDAANEEKTMFLYNMTQEIRNITNKIDDDADIILDSKELEVAYDSARDIKANTSKFTNMTNEILDVSQVDSETIKTYNSKYNIKNTLKQVINIYNEECKKKMLEFRTNIDHDIPESLYGDSISLKESLNKILKNSLDNTTTGYIELDVNTIIKNDICRLIITIEDSSNGIQSEALNTVKKDNKLLSEANSLIGVMQGTLMISSDYGVGTKVKVILDQKIVDSENKEVTKYVNTLDNVNVLVCDTESGLKVISKLLDGSNVKLDKVDNGKELLESIKENKYDLVLMDESTSTNNEILVSKMRSIRNFNSEIILLTRDNSYEYNNEYKTLGFDDYILKPLKKDILLDKINKYKD